MNDATVSSRWGGVSERSPPFHGDINPFWNCPLVNTGVSGQFAYFRGNVPER